MRSISEPLLPADSTAPETASEEGHPSESSQSLEALESPASAYVLCLLSSVAPTYSMATLFCTSSCRSLLLIAGVRLLKQADTATQKTGKMHLQKSLASRTKTSKLSKKVRHTSDSSITSLNLGLMLLESIPEASTRKKIASIKSIGRHRLDE